MDAFVALSLFAIGVYVLFIAIKHYTEESKCSNKIEYRYVPRTFKEQQESPVPVTDLFKKMFENETPRGLNWEDVNSLRTK